MARVKYKGQRLDQWVPVRVSEEQIEIVQKAADQLGVELSALWRDAIVKAAQQIVVSGAEGIVFKSTIDETGKKVLEIAPVKTEPPWKPVTERRESKDG